MPLGLVSPGPAVAYAWTPDSNAAIIAANATLRAGASLFRLSRRWTDGERTFPPGTFVLADDAPLGRALALASEYGVVLYPLTVLPQGLERLRRPLIAAHGDPAAALVLRELGFDVTTVTTEELGVGRTLDAYDVLVVSGGAPLWPRLSDGARQALWEYARRGGAIVGLGYAGSDLAIALGLADIDPTVTASNFSGMAQIVCDADDPIVGSYAGATPVLVRAPVWYTFLGEGATGLATYSPAAPLVTGYWPLWDDINPAGQATIVRLSGTEGGITLFGFDPTDAAYGRGAFRLLAQAIYHPLPDAGP